MRVKIETGHWVSRGNFNGGMQDKNTSAGAGFANVDTRTLRGEVQL